jgi:hypothetical protein
MGDRVAGVCRDLAGRAAELVNGARRAAHGRRSRLGGQPDSQAGRAQHDAEHRQPVAARQLDHLVEPRPFGAVGRRAGPVEDRGQLPVDADEAGAIAFDAKRRSFIAVGCSRCAAWRARTAARRRGRALERRWRAGSAGTGGARICGTASAFRGRGAHGSGAARRESGHARRCRSRSPVACRRASASGRRRAATPARRRRQRARQALCSQSSTPLPQRRAQGRTRVGQSAAQAPLPSIEGRADRCRG